MTQKYTNLYIKIIKITVKYELLIIKSVLFSSVWDTMYLPIQVLCFSEN